MSKKVPEEQYRQTFSYKFHRWLNGSEETFPDETEEPKIEGTKRQESRSDQNQEKNQEQEQDQSQEENQEQEQDQSQEENQKQEQDQNQEGNQKQEQDQNQEENQKQEQDQNKEKMNLIERVYDLEHNAEIRIFQRIYRVFSILFCIFLVAMLLTAVSELPDFGNAENPVNNEVAARYIENGLQETGAVNIVTGMILDYRAFDTLGESHVLFVATCTVLILLRNNKKEDEINDRTYEPKNDVILQTVARILVPPIFIFGCYLILAGHLGPGGGFSGGAVIGAGLILYLNAFGFAKTEKFFTAKTYQRISFCALACYSIAKSYSFYTGANHIESVIPLGQPGAILSSGLILLLNICVGVVVAGTMYTFYVMFRKGDY